MMSMNSILENNLLKVEVSSFGAELQSITSKASGMNISGRAIRRFGNGARRCFSL